MRLSMEVRVFLAIGLCFIVLVVSEKFTPKPAPTPTPAASASASASPTASPSASPAVASPAGTPQVAGAAPAPVATGAKALVTDTAARDIVVETDSYIATFNTQGAVMRSFRLLHYFDGAGKPLEMIPADMPVGSFARPFTLQTDDEKESATLASVLYEPSASSLTLGAEAGTLTFTYRDEAGLSAQKKFYFRSKDQEYLLNVEASVDVAGKPRPITIAFGPGIGPGYSPDGQRFTPPGALHFLDGGSSHLAAGDVQKVPRYEGKMRYAGLEDHYFVAVALLGDLPARADYSAVTVPVPGATEGTTRSFVSFSVRPNPGAAPSQSVAIPFYIGPKVFEKLSAAEPFLVKSIQFGWFEIIVVPLLTALKWINKYLGNYGWSIVVLTVIINILIFPLRHRSMVSMKKMQAIQPEVKAIQDRYAKLKVTDPERQKMNTEMFALYKQRGVSPASGCVPMLLTMPILLAFYNLLSQAIELRGAPFVGWIHDLAAKDPTYIWPILMGVTMFIQQRMMPSTADPTQQKIFMLMPIIFTFMFLPAPSGLVIYWLVSNLLTIAQQYITNSMTGGPVVLPAPRKG